MASIEEPSEEPLEGSSSQVLVRRGPLPTPPPPQPMIPPPIAKPLRTEPTEIDPCQIYSRRFSQYAGGTYEAHQTKLGAVARW